MLSIYKEVKAVNIPNSITIIPEYAFKGLTYITKLYMHDNVTYIGNYALPPNPTEIELSQSLEKIERGYSTFTYLIVPQGVKSINQKSYDVYYLGTPEDGLKILGGSNTHVIYYYSSLEPTDTKYTYWHYDENNKPVLW